VDPESKRLAERDPNRFLQGWESWGPYLSERSWGTVREDYSSDGDAWNSFPHEDARKRAFRWGDDGIAGICDRFQILLFAPAFWNGKDRILKERLFGLNSQEGNHGEDVKELYYYLDGTPTSSYLKYLYKYPHKAFPYDQLIEINKQRNTKEREFELIDTGIFEENRYFDIFIEYAKQGPDDLCMKIEMINRGPNEAPLHFIAQLWFRNQWSWSDPVLEQPTIEVGAETADALCLIADDRLLPSPRLVLGDYHLSQRYLYASPGAELLFTNNETNCQEIWNTPNCSPYVKDAFHRYLVDGDLAAVNPNKTGTKSGLHYFFPSIAPGQSQIVYLRLSPAAIATPLADIEAFIALRKKEADEFYQRIYPAESTDEEKMIQRQAFAGMNWNKQFYLYPVTRWMAGDVLPPPATHKMIRNTRWYHLSSMKILSMPDKWEYPWFAAWDLSFHAVSFALFDIEFAKQQLATLFIDRFQHPNGQIPAYEWEFSDANPPVQAWAALQLYEREKKITGKGDREFLEKIFHRLLLNFAWWVNKVDEFGNNAFEGGFLGMDNIDLFDRSAKLDAGYHIDEVDGAAWISFLCLNMMRISLLLAEKNPGYEGMGIKFLYHFVYVTAAMRKGYWRTYDLWDDEDSFFYSVFLHPDGSSEPFKVRSLEGVIPLFATDVWEDEELKKFPTFTLAYQWLLEKRPELATKCVQQIPNSNGTPGSKHLFGLLSTDEIARYLKILWNPDEFRSDFGLRSLSKHHLNHPIQKDRYSITYEPGESLERLMGGNSNWRGPIWFPINYLLIQTLQKISLVLGDTMKIQVGEEAAVATKEMALFFAESLLKLFKRDAQGNRPFNGENQKVQTDPHFKDYLLFYEHFHGDDGRGLGASHQTGWTGLVANIIEELRNQK
jgi:hypothetical protein